MTEEDVRTSGTDRRRMLQLSIAALGAAGFRSAIPSSQALAQGALRPAHTLRFGLNYVPRKSWWYIWQDWDPQAVLEDFQAIADLGMDHIRIQCLWPVFQPGTNFVSSLALGHLSEMLEMAGKVNLQVEVTVLDGWLSGYSFLPSWVAPTTREANVFTSEKVILAQQQLLRIIAETVRDHPNFLGLDLGNEINCLQAVEGNHATTDEADRWATRMLALADELAPGKMNVNGVDEAPWFSGSGFSRGCVANTGRATVLHCYAYFTGALKRYRYDEVGNLHLLEFMIELARAYQIDPERLVWVQEVGASPEWMPEAYIPEYLRLLFENAAASKGLWGFTWWCSHDIDTNIKGFDSLEYGLGVFDRRNRVKPVGKMLSKVAEEMRRSPRSPVRRDVGLVIPDKVSTTQQDAGWMVATKFFQLISSGFRPAIVLESRAADPVYVKQLGVDHLVRLKES